MLNIKLTLGTCASLTESMIKFCKIRMSGTRTK